MFTVHKHQMHSVDMNASNLNLVDFLFALRTKAYINRGSVYLSASRLITLNG